MIRILKGLNIKKHERDLHISRLKDLMVENEHQALFMFLYDNLTIIDNKASALLQFNSIVIAILAFLLKQNDVFQIVLIITFLLSSLLCLYTVFLHWSTSEDFSSIENHIDILLNVRETRSVIYRASWWLSTAGVIFFTIYQILVLLFAIP